MQTNASKLSNNFFRRGWSATRLNHRRMANVGIEFNSNTAVVGKNTINDAVTGLDRVPAAFGGTNTFLNMPTIRSGGC